MRNNKPVLLVEDNEIDALTVQRAMIQLNVTNPVPWAKNGEEALDYLRKKPDVMPCLILLDLNMPNMNGFELLKALKEDDNLRIIPVVVLTTSDEETDKFDTFSLGIAGYMVKPVSYKKFVDVIREIKMYWTISELPLN